MRPTPVAAGFQPCRPGSVSRAAKLGCAAIAKGVMLSAIPLAVADLTKSRREILIVARLYWRNSFFTRFVGIYWQQPLLPFSDEAARGLLHCRISMPPVSALQRTFDDRRLVPCVDGSGLARRIFTCRLGSVQPCVRPLSAVHMTAGHNALRGSGPGQKPAFENAVAQVGCPDRRIDRLCITCCSPSQPSHHARYSARSRYGLSATG